MASASQRQLDDLAAEMFELSKMGWGSRGLARNRSEFDISDTEFLTLNLLIRHEPLTVGELQRQVNVLPAQMSRVIRSLENKPDAPMIQCAINPTDKRKINVTLTDTGRQAAAAYRALRLARITDTLSCLGGDDRSEFIRLLRLVRSHLSQKEAARSSA